MFPKPIKNLILDFDGTIGDTRQLIVATMQQVIAKLELESRTNEQCAAMIGLPLRQTFADLIPMDEVTAALCEKTYRQLFSINNKRGAVQIFPHVAETIAALHRRGLTLTIASSRGRDSLCDFVSDMHLADCIKLIVSADDIQHAKPNPEAVLKTLDKIGGQADETMVVGDTVFDIEMGLNASCITCGVTYGNHSRKQLENAGAHFIVDDFADIKNIV